MTENMNLDSNKNNALDEQRREEIQAIFEDCGDGDCPEGSSNTRCIGYYAYIGVDTHGEYWIKVCEKYCIRAVHKALRRVGKLGVDYFKVKSCDDEKVEDLYFRALYVTDEKYAEDFVSSIFFAEPDDGDVQTLVNAFIEELVPDMDVHEEPVSFVRYIKALTRARDHDHDHGMYLKDTRDDTIYRIQNSKPNYIGSFVSDLNSGYTYVIPTSATYIDFGMVLPLNHGIVINLSRKYYANDIRFVVPTREEIEERKSQVRSMYESPEFYYEYNGVAEIFSLFGSMKQFVNGRVIVDGYGLYITDNDYLDKLFKMSGYNLGEPTIRDHSSNDPEYIPDDFLITCISSKVLYDLKTKTWMLGSEKHLRGVQFDHDAFEKVDMDIEKKEIIKRLCINHGKSQHSPDVVMGKGGGHVFLLHGAPGTGKTLTAESTAEMLQRPLYKMNLGEFVNIERLETGLQEALALTERWNAILLIDEADVALEKRNSSDIKRNAIVAVFLRLLEYYKGIMFLTSNRAKEFDPAFKSRITFGLQFTSPTLERRRYIWKLLMDNVGVEYSDEDLNDYAKHVLDGRQIKNIINTSIQLVGDVKQVRRAEIEKIIAQTLKFDRFMGQ